MKLKQIEQLEEKFGLPLYIFNSDQFIDNYNELLSEFKAVYPNYKISYSYKTNYTPRVCQIVKDLGGYAEVVSDMEYELAKKLGYENNKIIYNGPVKGCKLEEHILNGGLLNIDNYEEAKRVRNIAIKNTSNKFEVGIRFNIDVGADFISRFGFDEKSEEFSKSLKLLEDTPNISIVGVHCHISRARGLQAWEKRAKEMIRIADKYIQGIPKYISLGSGMYGHMDDELKQQFQQPVPTYQDYAVVVLTLFAEHYKNTEEDKKPIVFTEPGTTLVSKYFDIICKVDNIRNVRGRNLASLTCCLYNLGEICSMKKLPIQVFGDEGEYYNSIDLMGYTCLEQDCLYPDYKGNIAVDNYVLFGNVGGYSLVSKPPFIQPNCAVIEISNDDNVVLIKRQETNEDIFSTFVF